MENNTKNTKDAVLFVKVSDEEKAELQEIVDKNGEMTVSRFVREAIREKFLEAIRAAAERREQDGEG